MTKKQVIEYLTKKHNDDVRKFKRGIKTSAKNKAIAMQCLAMGQAAFEYFIKQPDVLSKRTRAELDAVFADFINGKYPVILDKQLDGIKELCNDIK